MQPQAWRVRRAATLLRDEGVIAYPTEGVWGLGCLPESKKAVARILALKDRPWDKGLILVAGELGELEGYIQPLTPAEHEEVSRFWPGPVTFLLEPGGDTPEWIRGEHPRVAVRISAHPVVRALCQAIGRPLVSTSANPAGKQPARTRLQLARYFEDRVDMIFPGNLGGSDGPSEIRDLATGQVLRPAGS